MEAFVGLFKQEVEQWAEREETADMEAMPVRYVIYYE